MKWTDWRAHWDADKSLRKRYTPGEFYGRLMSHAKYFEVAQLRTERDWSVGDRPYYHLYPGILDPFLRLDLGVVPVRHLRMPIESPLLIQLPDASSVVADNMRLCNILVDQEVIGDHENDGRGESSYITVMTDIEVPEQKLHALVTLDQRNDITIADAFEVARAHSGKAPHPGINQIIGKALQIVSVCLLLENDPQLISPEVLSDDLMKWQESLDPKFVEKAKRRGKFGWVVGRELEVIPHYRRPHCALFWVGIGRMIPIIRMRAGSIVHREVVTTIPTGYGGDVEDADAVDAGAALATS